MSNLRIRCQVLKVIANFDGVTSLDIRKHIPELSAEQIQKAVYNLLQQDRVKKNPEPVEREGSSGRPLFRYECNLDYEKLETKKVTRKKVGRKSYPESLQTAPPVNDNFVIVKFRDRKIRLLKSIMDKSVGTDKDLLMGMLNDYSNLNKE